MTAFFVVVCLALLLCASISCAMLNYLSEIPKDISMLCKELSKINENLEFIDETLQGWDDDTYE